MAHAKRSDVEAGAIPIPSSDAPDRHYDAGGQVAQLQADLARRLASQGDLQGAVLPVSSAERVVRRFSVAGGYLALLAGYALAAVAITRLL